MIYTLTANPAIDYHMDLTEAGLRPGEINRSSGEEMLPGGKGLNVSVILAELGTPSIAWGFTAGKAGNMLEALAAERGCRCDFIRLPKGETRINVKLDCEQETAVNGIGPQIGAAEVEELLERVRTLTSNDTLILSGNLQAGTVNLYEAICRVSSSKGVRIVVDTEGGNLKQTFAYRPFLIKPNEEELLALYGSSDTGEIVTLMSKCREEGVSNVMVTLGSKGALLLTEDGALYRAVVRGQKQAVSTVGAGDSTVAAFLAGLARYQGADDQYEKALQLACAAGTATACCKWLARREEIEEMMKDILTERIG